jgi:hypothetical protein
MSETTAQVTLTLRQACALDVAIDDRLRILDRRIERAAKNRAAGNVTFGGVDEGNRNERQRLRECQEQVRGVQRVICTVNVGHVA